MNLHDCQEFKKAFDYFNEGLFGNELPEVILTIKKSGKGCGYFHAEQFTTSYEGEPGTLYDEIGMNAAHFHSRGLKDVLSTLVHEMCHEKQFHFGKKCPKTAYHNKEFAGMMEEVGLVCSDTGYVGGKKTGVNMTHYIVPLGPFDAAAIEFLRDYNFELFFTPYSDPDETEKPKPPGKVKVVCPDCKLSAWLKEGDELSGVVCNSCDSFMNKEEE